MCKLAASAVHFGDNNPFSNKTGVLIATFERQKSHPNHSVPKLNSKKLFNSKKLQLPNSNVTVPSLTRKTAMNLQPNHTESGNSILGLGVIDRLYVVDEDLNPIPLT